MQHVEKIGRVEKVFARRDRFEPLTESVVQGDDHREGGNQAQGFLPRRRIPPGCDRITSDVSRERRAAMRSASIG
jgi:hypothetical protein